MKTSNRILLGLISCMVILPVIMLWGFKNKIARNDFTVEKYSWTINTNKVMPLKASRFIKLLAPDSAKLNCYLKYGTADQYQLNSYDTDDSLSVELIGDTLFFRFMPAPRLEKYRQEPDMDFSLSLSAVQSIYAESVNLTIDSMGQSDSLQLHLVNHSKVDFGTEDSNEKPVPYGKILVTADNSDIRLYPKLTMQSLTMKLTGNASLEIDKEAKIGKVSGTISPTSIVNGPASYLYQLLFDQN